MEKKKLIRKIFAWIALVAAAAAAISITIYFFNILGDASNICATISLICVAVTAVFFIIAKFVLADPEELSKPKTDEQSNEELPNEENESSVEDNSNSNEN